MPLQRPRHLLSCVVLGASLLLSGCGFHLRGTSAAQMEGLSELSVSAQDRHSLTYRNVLDAMQANKLQVHGAAPYHLELLDESSRQRALTYAQGSTAGEYEITRTLVFRISDRQGRPLIGPETLSTQRDYVNDRDNLLGTGEEEALLQREMSEDLIRQLMSRLSSISASDLAVREQALDQLTP